eukprot:1042044-Pleurochrysis_carterae.AAC.4
MLYTDETALPCGVLSRSNARGGAGVSSETHGGGLLLVLHVLKVFGVVPGRKPEVGACPGRTSRSAFDAYGKYAASLVALIWWDS